MIKGYKHKTGTVNVTGVTVAKVGKQSIQKKLRHITPIMSLSHNKMSKPKPVDNKNGQPSLNSLIQIYFYNNKLGLSLKLYLQPLS